MWWRILLIAIYIFLLLILSRILDAVAYYQGGFFAHKLLDPVSLGVQKLKALLDQRGLNYMGIFEKADLSTLVKNSGAVTNQELQTATSFNVANEEELTIFSCAEHFHERVEDSKDSAWLIQVSGLQTSFGKPNRLPITNHKHWKSFLKKISRFGIRNGVVNCELDPLLCIKKEWMASQLVLALPEGHKPKDHVVLSSLLNPTTPDQVASWVEHQLAERFHEISTVYDLEYNWLNNPVSNSYSSVPNKKVLRRVLKMNNSNQGSFCNTTFNTPGVLDNPLKKNCLTSLSAVSSESSNTTCKLLHESVLENVSTDALINSSKRDPINQISKGEPQEEFEKIKVIFMSPLNLIPMFLSALSVKFSGRVKFGFFHKNQVRGFPTKSESRIDEKRSLKMKSIEEKIMDRVSMATGDYIVVMPEGKMLYGMKGRGLYHDYNSFSFFLKTLHPEVNDIFILSLLLVNALTCLNLILSRIISFAMRALETILLLLTANFFFLIIWVAVLGFLQLPQSESVTNHALSCLRHISLTGFVGYMRADFMRIAEISWGAHACFLAVYLYMAYRIKRRFAPPDEVIEVSDLISFSRQGMLMLMQTLFQHHGGERDGQGNLDTIEAGMEMLIESMAIPRLWLEPVISPLYVHELPVWRFGCSPTDGTDSETGDIEVSRCQCPNVRMKPRGDSVGSRDLEESEQRSDEERAKLVMDGDYICTCGHRGDEAFHDEPVVANSEECLTDESRGELDSDQETDAFWSGPVDMIPAVSCSICLERYRKGAIICGLPCGHHYHQMCIKLWLMRDHHCCPICRWPSFKRKAHKETGMSSL